MNVAESERVGGKQKNVDSILQQPAIGETAFVQVKSKAGQAVLPDYVGRFKESGTHKRLFFICHSPKGKLKLGSDSELHLWTGEPLAAAAVKAGLFEWLIERCNRSRLTSRQQQKGGQQERAFECRTCCLSRNASITGAQYAVFSRWHSPHPSDVSGGRESRENAILLHQYLAWMQRINSVGSV